MPEGASIIDITGDGRRASETIWSRGFVMLCVSGFLMGTSFYFLMPTLPLYIGGELHADNMQIGFILAVYTIAALAIRPFAGYWVDRYGRRMFYVVPYAAFALLFASYAAARSVPALYAVRTLHGMAWGVLGTAGGALVVDLLPPQRRGEGIGIYGLSFTVAMAAGPAIGMRLVETAGFPAMFITAAVLALAGLLTAVAVPYPAYRAPVPPPALIWGRLIEKSAIPASLNMLLITIGYGGLLPFVAIHGKAIGIAHPGTFFVVFAAAIGVTRIIAGKVFDRRGPGLVVSMGIVLIVAGFPLLAVVRGAAGYFSAATALGLGMGMLMPTFSAMVNNMVPPERRGAANSTFMTAFDLGIGIGMALMGSLSDLIPLERTFFVSSALGLGALVLFTTWTAGHYRKHAKE